MKEQKICTRCVLDNTVPDIWYDENGECKYCKIHDEMEKKYPLGKIGKEMLNRIIENIKRDGKGKRYDCIVGFSGGRDSTYTLLRAVKLGLRPLAVHFDNGWNSETAVSNIKKTTDKLGVDLHTVVADWEEFKSLQIAFLRASVPDAETPTDYAIYSVLFNEAAKEGIKYVLQGHSFRTEGTSPIGWTYMDGRYLRDIFQRYGAGKIKSFPLMSMSKLLYYILLKRIKEVRLLEYVEYNQKKVDTALKKELDWTYYGGHHHESVYTKFFQSYLLPKKFNIDKRKTECSALVRSGQLTRKEALKKLKTPYPFDESNVDYCIKKLGLSKKQFEEINNTPAKSFHDYRTYYPLMQMCKVLIKIACRLHILPPILRLKYLQ
ncbi:N-acetyl sugar amidotransferase [Candidatus Woesearchaeota archaeon CG11_big_fil_rev_8_21_14_0_20_43_8]|nr:MAG: N-acetyl sugar amidotransferase [Candidatus Woesearchaeota archaeon CG11_big_fil_rev_8_21_14_0_20_43_8]PIO08824.1 MAG: N-acetyl sugar amidotransferase [Candidatus Woesearchaeota archaeon CG08_land_8_20_14_0_20_43_7]